MILLEILSAIEGHAKLFIEEKDSTKRAELAETVKKRLSEGHAIFLIQDDDTRQVKGYDPEANEWLVLSDTKEQTPRIRASGGRLTAIAPTAGG